MPASATVAAAISRTPPGSKTQNVSASGPIVASRFATDSAIWATSPTATSPQPYPVRVVVSRRYGRVPLKVSGVVAALVSIFFVVFGVFTGWHSLVTLPRTYDNLEAHGVPATATLEKCARGLGGGRGVGCRLSLTFAGSTRAWNYPENSRQFEGLPVGSGVPVLVDSKNPGTAYTVTDVRARTNAGFGPVVALGIAFVLIGASIAVAIIRVKRRLVTAM